MPELLAETRTEIRAMEYGLLDGLDDRAVRDWAPGNSEERLVSRMADGREVILGKAVVEPRLQKLFAQLDEQGFDLIVLLCTGHFAPFQVRTPFLEPQHAVDHFTLGLTHGLERLGVLVPNRAQIEEFHEIPGKDTVIAYASPYRPEGMDELRLAADKLKDACAIVMHCMGYTETMRRVVKERTGRPVLLPRRIVAHAMDLLLS